MRRFWAWCKRPHAWWEIVLCILAGFAAMELWRIVIEAFLFLNFRPYQLRLELPFWYFFTRYFIGAMNEELISRVIPIVLAYRIIGYADPERYRRYNLILIYVIAINSIWFGLMHGSILSVFIQGVSGVILWAVFLYASRIWQKGYRLKGFFAATASHCLFNLALKFFH